MRIDKTPAISEDQAKSCESLTDFFELALSRKRAQNKRWTLSAWARKLGIRNVSTMWRFVHGERTVNDELLDLVLSDLKCDHPTSQYVRYLMWKAKYPKDKGLQAFLENCLENHRQA